MIKLLVLCSLVGAAVAIPPAAIASLAGGSLSKPPSSVSTPVSSAPVPVPVVPIVSSESNIEPDGSSYEYSFETGNGISVEQSGDDLGTGDDSVDGSFQYKSPEGVDVAISYIADEDGYQPEGDVLPTPPPIPPLIQRALAYIEAHPETSTTH